SRSGVLYTPTITSGGVPPAARSRAAGGPAAQATPKAAAWGAERFWPSCMDTTGGRGAFPPAWPRGRETARGRSVPSHAGRGAERKAGWIRTSPRGGISARSRSDGVTANTYDPQRGTTLRERLVRGRKRSVKVPQDALAVVGQQLLDPLRRGRAQHEPHVVLVLGSVPDLRVGVGRRVRPLLAGQRQDHAAVLPPPRPP